MYNKKYMYISLYYYSTRTRFNYIDILNTKEHYIKGKFNHNFIISSTKKK